MGDDKRKRQENPRQAAPFLVLIVIALVAAVGLLVVFQLFID